MQDPLMFAVYGVVSVALIWSLVNSGSAGWLVGGDGQVSADEGGEGFGVSFFLRAVVLLFCLVGCGHALGIVDDPLSLLRKALTAI